MRFYFKTILDRLLIYIVISGFVSSCSLFEDEASNSLTVFEDITFSIDRDYCFTNDTLSISMDKPIADISKIDILFGNQDAEVVSWDYVERILIVRVPFIEDNYSNLQMVSELDTTVILTQLRVYPGTLNFELLGETPFTGRTDMSTYNADGINYLLGGRGFKAEDSTYLSYDDVWKFDAKSNQLEEVQSIEGFSSAADWAGGTFFYQGSTYRVQTFNNLYYDYGFSDINISKLDSVTDTWNEEYSLIFEDSNVWIQYYMIADNKIYLNLSNYSDSDVLHQLYKCDVTTGVIEHIFTFPNSISGYKFIFIQNDIIYLYAYAGGTFFAIIQYDLIDGVERRFYWEDGPKFNSIPEGYNGAYDYNIPLEGYSVMFSGAKEGETGSYYKITSK